MMFAEAEPCLAQKLYFWGEREGEGEAQTLHASSSWGGEPRKRAKKQQVFVLRPPECPE